MTINALFYNINKKEVEDCTGTGLDDLWSKTLRTPIDPYITFTDDPNRILRTIRFAGRARKNSQFESSPPNPTFPLTTSAVRLWHR